MVNSVVEFGNLPKLDLDMKPSLKKLPKHDPNNSVVIESYKSPSLMFGGKQRRGVSQELPDFPSDFDHIEAAIARVPPFE